MLNAQIEEIREQASQVIETETNPSVLAELASELQTLSEKATEATKSRSKALLEFLGLASPSVEVTPEEPTDAS